jgi:ubiquinone/menaquinone biosynthesis C-methylase UbiE
MPYDRIGNSVAYSAVRFQDRTVVPPSPLERTIAFYEDATEDYEHWSSGFNMHLGFYRRGMNPFDREGMLEQLNTEIGRRLRLDPHYATTLIDLGCGVGAISRTIARNYPNAVIKGVTVSPTQVKTANRLNKLEALDDRIEILNCDYRDLPFDDGYADGVWAVESACYAAGSAKEDLVTEMARILKLGGRFAVADCFLRKPKAELTFPVGHFYSSVCKNWALDEMPVLDSFLVALEAHGFRNIVVEDISWRVVPSLAHAPAAVLGFILRNIYAGRRLNTYSVGNLTASLLAPVLGLNRSKFSYCLISGTLVV